MVEVRLKNLEDKLVDYDEHKEKLEKTIEKLEMMEQKMASLEELKEDFADKLKAKLTKMEVDSEMKQASNMQDL